MKLKKILIPFLCFIVAILVLYGRVFIPHDLPSLNLVKPSVPFSLTDVITIHYLDRPPYYSSGPLGVYGLCADPTKLAFKKADIKFRWESTPTNRQLDILKNNKSKVCLIGWFKNSEREKYAKYSSPIYQDKPTIALARADNYNIRSGKTLDEIFQNDNLTLLMKNGYSYGQYIDKKIAILKPNQITTNSKSIEMIQMIFARRADYFFISKEEAIELTELSGLLKSEFKYIKFKNLPKGNKRYLLFSKMVEDKVIEKINRAIKKYNQKDVRISKDRFHNLCR